MICLYCKEKMLKLKGVGITDGRVKTVILYYCIECDNSVVSLVREEPDNEVAPTLELPKKLVVGYDDSEANIAVTVNTLIDIVGKLVEKQEKPEKQHYNVWKEEGIK